MVKHGMNLIKDATEHVNPGQIPVLTVDQPLYAIDKKIQWIWPATYGEDKYVVLTGGLHIEMVMLKVMGDWLEGSGWASVMAAATVTTEGRADSLQKGSHTSRAQWAHQVTAAVLLTLHTQAYVSYREIAKTQAPPEIMSFLQWCQTMEASHPQFCYWNKTLRLQLLFLHFLKSQREANFLMYVETLGHVNPWLFPTGH